MMITIFLYWLPMIVLAFVNATIRELILVKHFTLLRAHQLSTITLTLFCSVYIYFITPYLQIRDTKHAIIIGFMWVLFTVLFEFVLGRLTHKSWSVLLQQYNLLEGQIWPLFLLVLFVLPYFCFIIRR